MTFQPISDWTKDNFYDQSGELTEQFFSGISLNVKRRFWLMVNGNHDNWVCGFPMCGSSNDDFGIGQMQYYPMDSIASQDNQIFSFDVDPDQNRQWNQFLNNASNFMFYHKLGNVACMQKCQNKKMNVSRRGRKNFMNQVYCL